MSNMKELAKQKSTTNRFRIIGGEFRGRKLSFDGQSTARPTSDRVKETLFNWLEPSMEGSRCLDLFAGSGALGLEALSRGAKEVVFVDHDKRLINGIQSHLTMLNRTNARVVSQSAIDYLEQSREVFDIVFLDPPFEDQMLDKLCTLLASNLTIAPEGHCYLEMASTDEMPNLPAHWQVRRDKKAGRVRYALIDVEAP